MPAFLGEVRTGTFEEVEYNKRMQRSAALMKRMYIPLLVGIAVAVGGPTLAALVLYRSDPDTIIPILLYWPLFITDKLGLGQNCGDADLISDKLTCIRTALYIDAVLYPVVICVCAYFARRILVRRAVSSNL